MSSWKDNIYFILIEPREPGNIGAAARAMKNMGFNKLELVNPAPFHTREAKWMSCQAYDMVKNAIVYKSFKEAINEKNLVIGTTRRLGKRRGIILPLRDSLKRIISAAKNNKIAILFGRERIGLLNKEVDSCGFMITIPSEPEAGSLNLSQSVMLVAYELAQKTYKTESPEFIKNERLDGLYERIEYLLKVLEYIPRGDRQLGKKIMKNLKHFIGRAGLTEWELNMLQGLCAQIENKINFYENV